MTYEETVARLGEALTFGINPSLDGIRMLTEALGRPQDSFRCVQVTGTNGKTSVTRLIAALLSEHGYRTGLYTSPHLISYTERIEVDGKAITEAGFADAMGVVLDAARGLGREFTEFELLTAAALYEFRERGVEWACLEVGMGGRWDATSVVAPAVSVVTGVSLDHTAQLGATREQIAADKAYVIKPGCTVVLGPGCAGVEHIFVERARGVGALVVQIHEGEGDYYYRIVRRPRKVGGTLVLDFEGVRELHHLKVHAPSYQAPNIATAVAAVGVALWAVLDVPTLRRTLKRIKFPGRFEELRRDPLLLIDGAHNPEAAGVLAGAIEEAFGQDKPALLLAVLGDKDAEGIVRALAPVCSAVIATENGSRRCMEASELAAVVARVTGVRAVAEPDLDAALELAQATGKAVVATGSLYTAGAVRNRFI